MSITTDINRPAKSGKKRKTTKSSNNKEIAQVLDLDDENSCYILITCRKPCDEGEMQVEFSYQGEPALVSYLLHGAQNYIDGELEESLSV